MNTWQQHTTGRLMTEKHYQTQLALQIIRFTLFSNRKYIQWKTNMLNNYTTKFPKKANNAHPKSNQSTTYILKNKMAAT